MVRNSEWDRENPATATDAEQFGDIIESTTTADASEYDVVLLGEPYDGGTTGRAGARDGPAAIRTALADVETHHLDAGPVDSVGDVGAIEIPASAPVSTAQSTVRETVSQLHEAETIPVIFAGSGSLTYANVVGLLEATAATDGAGYVTDGGFGEDEDSVGDVEHFDPTTEAVDEDDDSGQADEDDDKETDATDDSGADGSAETDERSDEDRTPADNSEPGTGDDVVEDDKTEQEVAEEDESEVPTEQAEAQTEDDEENGSNDETEEADVDEAPEEAGEQGGEADADEPTEEASKEEDETEAGEVTEDGADEEDDTDGDDEDTAAVEDTADGSAVDDTVFAMSDSEAKTEVIEESAPVTHTEPADESAASPETGGDTTSSAAASVGVISLDARLDCRPADGGPTNRNSYPQLFEAGLDALAVLGARHFESSTTEAEYLRDRDGMVVTAEEVGDDPVEAADRALGAMEDVEQIYVSIDLSVLDSAAAPGVSDPAPGGLSTRELFRVVRLLASDDRIAGFELIEAVPSLDQDNRTVDAAARTVAHAVATVSE